MKHPLCLMGLHKWKTTTEVYWLRYQACTRKHCHATRTKGD